MQNSANLQESANNATGHVVVVDVVVPDVEVPRNTNNNIKQSPYSVPPDSESADDVSQGSDENSSQPGQTTQPIDPNLDPEPDHQSVIRELVGAGVDPASAEEMARTYSASSCSTAVGYVRSRGRAIRNPGGYLRSLLESGADLAPVTSGPTPANRSTPLPPRPPESQPRTVPDATPRPDPERERRRDRSPHASVWEQVADQIRQRILPITYEPWFEPLFIASISDGAVLIDAPTEGIADWVQEHYDWLLEVAFIAAGIPFTSIRVETSPAATHEKDPEDE